VSCEAAAVGRRAQGSGSSRRAAEQEAAERVLNEIAELTGVAKV
jgi:dsRNA-specific ribonuclease